MSAPPTSSSADVTADHVTAALTEYRSHGSVAAFRVLVDAYYPLVWRVAQRVLQGDAALAQDVAQMVFNSLAQQAARLPERVVLPAWLHRCAVNVASTQIRSNVRRRQREMHSAIMNEPAHSDVPDHRTDPAQLAALDQALDSLAEADRQALVLRFYDQQTFASVAEKLRITEEAARKRVNRAMDKLRSRLTPRTTGVLTAAALLSMLENSNAGTLPSEALENVSAITSKALSASSANTAGLAMGIGRRLAIGLSAAALLVLGIWSWWRWSQSASTGVEISSAHPASSNAPTNNPNQIAPTVEITFCEVPISQMPDYAAFRDPADDEALLARLTSQINSTKTGYIHTISGPITCSLTPPKPSVKRGCFHGLTLGNSEENYNPDTRKGTPIVYIKAVLPDSAGDIAGVREDQTLRSINGHPPIDAAITTTELDDSLHGQPILLTLRGNDGKDFTVTVVATDYAETRKKYELLGWLPPTVSEVLYEGQGKVGSHAEVEYVTDYSYNDEGVPKADTRNFRNVGDEAQLNVFVNQSRDWARVEFSAEHFYAPVLWRDWSDNPEALFPTASPSITQPEFFSYRGISTVELAPGGCCLVCENLIPLAHLPPDATEPKMILVFLTLHL